MITARVSELISKKKHRYCVMVNFCTSLCSHFLKYFRTGCEFLNRISHIYLTAVVLYIHASVQNFM